jgi:dTDP-4-dehydrorhamnose reductase
VKRLLVTGAAGLLGGRLTELLAAEFATVAGVLRSSGPAGVPAVPLDITSQESIAAAFETARPDAVLHAAVANVDRCESDPAGSSEVNVRGTALVAEACARRGARLVALSTDLVFAGPAPAAGIDETHPTGPLLGYGRTKLAGEEEALRGCAGSAAVRIALVCGRGFGPRGTSSEGVAWALHRGKRPRLFRDQWRTPVDAEAIAVALARLLHGAGEGRYHLGGPERVSRYELGVRTAAAFALSSGNIEAVSQETLSLGEPRPADVSLDSGRARRELGFSPRPLDEMIRDGRPEGPPV